MLLTKLYRVFAIYTDESTALMSFDVAPAHSYVRNLSSYGARAAIATVAIATLTDM
jgi:hypothetical protein